MQTIINPVEHLDQEHQAASQLLALLKLEQERLIDADIDGLTPLTEDKSRLLTRLNELGATRLRWLAAKGLPASEAGMLQWISGAAGVSAGKARACLRELLVLIRAAKEINHTNGMLIGTHLSRNQAALNVLHHQGQGGGVYGPNGQTTGGKMGRRLVLG